jgi:colicin import membrane protein
MGITEKWNRQIPNIGEIMTDIVEKNALLVPFDPIEADIAKYKEENSKLVFDYEDAKGNKDARSHIFKLRQIKSSISKIHQEVKADVLKVSRSIDAKKNQLTDAVEEMIEVHAKPIKAIEDRVASEEAEKQRMIQEEAARQEAARIEAIRQQEEANRKRQAELDAQAAILNAKQAELDRQEREKKIAAEAEQRVKESAERQIKEAEEKHRQELAAAEQKRLVDLKAAEEKAAREKAAAEFEQKRLADIEAKRQANVNHRKQVNGEVLAILLRHGTPEENAKILVEDLSNDQYPKLKIIY